MPNPSIKSMSHARTRPRRRRGRRRRERICDCRCSSCRSSAGHRNRGRRRSHTTRTCPNAPLTRANRTRWALRSHIHSRIRDPNARCSCSVALSPLLRTHRTNIRALSSSVRLPPSTLLLTHIPYPISHIPHPISHILSPTPHTPHHSPISHQHNHKLSQTHADYFPPPHMSPRTSPWHMFSGRRSGSRRCLPRYAWALVSESSLWNGGERQSEKEAERERQSERKRKGRRTSYNPLAKPPHHAPRFLDANAGLLLSLSLPARRLGGVVKDVG